MYRKVSFIWCLLIILFNFSKISHRCFKKKSWFSREIKFEEYVQEYCVGIWGIRYECNTQLYTLTVYISWTLFMDTIDKDVPCTYGFVDTQGYSVYVLDYASSGLQWERKVFVLNTYISWSIIQGWTWTQVTLILWEFSVKYNAARVSAQADSRAAPNSKNQNQKYSSHVCNSWMWSFVLLYIFSETMCMWGLS